MLGLGAQRQSRDMLCPRPGAPRSPYHPLHDDDLGPQRLTDGEDVHQAEAEHDEVQGQDHAPRVQQRREEPGPGRAAALSSRSQSPAPAACPLPRPAGGSGGPQVGAPRAEPPGRCYLERPRSPASGRGGRPCGPLGKVPLASWRRDLGRDARGPEVQRSGPGPSSRRGCRAAGARPSEGAGALAPSPLRLPQSPDRQQTRSEGPRGLGAAAADGREGAEEAGRLTCRSGLL